MGAAATPWEALAGPARNPVDAGKPGLHVPLDLVLPAPSAPGLDRLYPERGVLFGDPWHPQDWSFPAQRLIDSGKAVAGTRVACADPHASMLAARGVVPIHRTPATLLRAALKGGVTIDAPRQVRVEVHGRLPPGADAIDLALWIVREAGPGGWATSLLHVGGETIESMDPPARQILAAGLGEGRPLSLRLGSSVPQTNGPFHEVLVVNATHVEPLVRLPQRGAIVPLRRLPPIAASRIHIGGCVGGGAATLAGALEELRRRTPAPGVAVHLVAASRAQHQQMVDRELALDLPEGVHLTPPHALGSPDSSVLTTTPCLAPLPIVAGLPAILEAAHTGRLGAPEASR